MGIVTAIYRDNVKVQLENVVSLVGYTLFGYDDYLINNSRACKRAIANCKSIIKVTPGAKSMD